MAAGTHRLRRAACAALRWLGAGMRAMAGPIYDLAFVESRSALVTCPACGADHVCPVEWESTDETHWWIRLRCGACESMRDVVVTDAVANTYDAALGRQTAVIQRAVAELDRQRMAAQLDTFVAALQHDLIDASSFA